MPHRVASHRPRSLPQANRHQSYDRYQRDREAKAFYNSRAWRMLRSLKLALDPVCEDCLKKDMLVPATVVHHEKERSEHPHLALSLENLRSKCAPCHSRLHASECKEMDMNTNECEQMHAPTAPWGGSPATA